MKATTKIEWTDHTINFWWGCTKVSPACTNCYAEGLGKFFGGGVFGQPVIWGKGQPRFQRLEAARKEAVKLNAKAEGASIRPRVFVNSMSDWLDDEVPIEWLSFLLDTIRLCPHLDFQLLTKRPENFKERVHQSRMSVPAGDPFSVWITKWIAFKPGSGFPPPNVWIGTTVENQHYADLRIPQLLAIPAKVRFLSCEPLVDALNLNLAIRAEEPHGQHFLLEQFVHWVIAGGESGGKAQPSDPDWFRSLRDQCKMAGVPFFFKQWGEWLPAGHEADHLPTTKTYKSKMIGNDLDGTVRMLRCGKELAGKRLDGQEWQQFPAP